MSRVSFCLACFFVLAAACTPTLSQPRGEAHLDSLARARRLYHHGHYSDAAAAYGEAASYAQRRVDEDEARYRQAAALRRAGHDADALPLFDQIAARRPISRRTARALFEAARTRYELGRRGEAKAGFLRLVREHSESGNASRGLFWYLRIVREDGGEPAYLAEVQRLREELGGSSLGDDLEIAHADFLIERGEKEQAVALLEDLVEARPFPESARWDDALWRLADLAEEKGEFARAADYLERMIAVHETSINPGSYTRPLMPEASIRIARLWKRAGNLERAAEAYEHAYDEFPASRFRDDALYELALLYAEQNEIRRACRLMHQAVGEFDSGHARRLAAQFHAAHCR